MKSTKSRHREPPRWITQLYRRLAAGRYSAQWLPEFLILFEQILTEDGESAAMDWALKELSLSLRPGIAARMLPFVRLAHRMWKAYRLASGR